MLAFVSSQMSVAAETLNGSSSGAETTLLSLSCDSTWIGKLEREAQAADPHAIESLALAYDRGCGVQQDMLHAGSLFERAIALGANDDYALGYVAFAGTNRARNVADALRLFKRSSDAGNPFAPLALCHLYESRQTPDQIQGYRFAVLGSERGDAYAKAIVGRLQATGAGTYKDFDKGVAILHGSNLAPYENALANIDLFYSPPPRRNAAHDIWLLNDAIRQGNAAAAFTLVIYDVNENRLSDLRFRGLQLIERARRMIPHSDADIELAYMLYNGIGVPKNIARAIAMTRDAASEGDIDSKYRIANWTYLGLNGIERDAAVGMRLYEVAATAGSSRAKRDLAIIRSPSISGTGVEATGMEPPTDDPNTYNWQKNIGTLPQQGSASYPEWQQPH